MADSADQAMASIRADAIRADMRFLSDDLLDGRGIETRGFGIAAKFMASQFEALGLKPAGNSGYFQNVPLHSARLDEARTSSSLIRNGQAQALKFREDSALYHRKSR